MHCYLATGVIFLFSGGPCNDNGLFLKLVLCAIHTHKETHMTKIAFRRSFGGCIHKFPLAWLGMELKDEITYTEEASFCD